MQKLKDASDNLDILVIDDNPDDNEFLGCHLEKVRGRNINLECCLNLTTGLVRLQRGDIHLVFLDLSLPDSSGIDTLRLVHKAAPTVPIVVLTGSDNDDLALQALKSGAQDYLVKGRLDPQSLGRSITYAIERQRSYTALQWLEAVVESSNDAIIGKSLENKILSWNHGAERLFGYQAVEVFGKSMDILIPPGAVNDSQLTLQRLREGQTIAPYESKRLTKDGKIITVYLSASAILDEEGDLTGVSCLFHDITQQKLTEKLLREADERLKLSVSSAKIGLWDWDLQNNQVRWDAGMHKLFGLSEGQIVPSFESFIECVHPDDCQRVQQTVEGVTTSYSGQFDFNFRTVWRDGTIHYLESKGEVFSDEHGNSLRMTGACFDTTDRTMAENALAYSEERLRLALDCAKMGVWDWNLQNNTVWRSLEHDKILGYEQMLPEWNYEMFLSHVVSGDRAVVQETIERGLEHGKYTLECRIINAKERAIRWISSQGEAHKDSTGNNVRIVGTIKDITEEKLLEQLANQSRQRRERISQAIVEHAPIGIVILDSNFKVTNANNAFAAMTHLHLDQLINQPLSIVLPEQAHQTTREFIATGKQLRVPRLEVAIANQASILQRHWDLSFWPVSDDQAHLTGAVMQIIDCTELVMLEQQREDFVASVAHDIKNPLIGADRIYEVLCDPSASVSPENQANMLSVLRDGNKNLLSLVQNLVDVHRFETLGYVGYYEEIDLQSIVRSCVEQVSHFAQRHGVAVRNTVLDAVAIRGDAVGIRRVLMNLLHNAVKFSEEGGIVEIAAERVDDLIRMRVTDTGVGISDLEQKKLFQRFAQGKAGKRYTSGTGLGLFLCKHIIEGNQGTIACHSKLGSGTTFVITLPVNEAPA